MSAMRTSRGLSFFTTVWILACMHPMANTETDASTTDALTTENQQSTASSEPMDTQTKPIDVSSSQTSPCLICTSERSRQYSTPNTSLYNTASPNTAYSDYAGKITLPVALFVGLIGNTMTVVTMVTKPFRSMTWSIFLTSLALTDNVVLLAVPFNKPFVMDLIGMDVPSINRASCKLYHFIRRISKMVSAWLIVLVCLERFIAVCFPLKVKQICTRRRTTLSVVGVVCAAAAYCSLWISTTDVVNGVCLQTVITPESRFKAMLYITLGSVLIVVLPMAIMAVITPITCLVLRRHMLVRSQLSGASGQTDNYLKASAMLISLCVAYVVLLIPSMVSYNLAFYYKQSLLTTKILTLIVLREISNVLELINYSSNFFLYTAFNNVFRRRVMNCLTCHGPTAVVTEQTSMTQSHNASFAQRSNRYPVSISSKSASVETVLPDFKINDES